jgi:hypothetical protein
MANAWEIRPSVFAVKRVRLQAWRTVAHLGGSAAERSPHSGGVLARERSYKPQLHLSQGMLKPLCLVPAETKNFSILKHGICYDVHSVGVLQNEKKGMKEGEKGSKRAISRVSC